MTAPVAPAPTLPTDLPMHTSVHTPTEKPPRPDRVPLVQRLLLGAGALCVLVAGSVYLAVSWHTLGVTGQATIALGVTGLAAVAAHLLTRRGLRASAETFGLVATGLLALDLTGAHHLDVLGAARLEWWTWLTAAIAVVGLVAAALAVVDRLSAYRSAAVAALGVLPWAGTQALRAAGVTLTTGGGTVVALTVAAGLIVVGAVSARRDRVAAGTAAVVAALWWVVAAASGVAASLSTDTVGDVLPAGLAWAAAAGGLLWLTGRVLRAGRTADTFRLSTSVIAPSASAPGILVIAFAATRLGSVAALPVAVGVAALFALRWPTSTAGRPVGSGALAVSALLPVLTLADGQTTDVAGGLTLLLAVTLATAALRLRGTVSGLAAGTALAATLGGIALTAVERERTGLWLTSGWTLVAVALTVAAAFVARRRGAVTACALLTSAITLVAGVIDQAIDTRSPALVVALLGLGGAQLAYGAARAARLDVVLGVAAFASAAMDLAALGHIHTLEAYTLPVAAVALVAGGLTRVGRPSSSSWVWAGPGVAIVLLPSTVTALADTGVTRLVVTAVVAAGLTALGVGLRWAAPLVLGAVTEAVLAVSQLAPYAVGAPRWITLAAAGAVLLALGVLFERARHGVRAAGRWYTTLR